ncbi:MAG: hypothetical protein ACMUJM_02110 [bacterium]
MLPIQEAQRGLKKVLPAELKSFVLYTLSINSKQLPAIIISSLECHEEVVGIDDIIGSVHQEVIETGTIKGTRIIGTI